MAQESEEKTSKNGKDYLRLKKVTIEEGATEDMPFNSKDKPEPVFKPKNDAYLRDISTIPETFIRALLPYYDVQRLQDDPAQYSSLIETARALTEDSIAMIEKIREGEPLETGYDKAKKVAKKIKGKSEEDFGEEDIPYDE